MAQAAWTWTKIEDSKDAQTCFGLVPNLTWSEASCQSLCNLYSISVEDAFSLLVCRLVGTGSISFVGLVFPESSCVMTPLHLRSTFLIQDIMPVIIRQCKHSLLYFNVPLESTMQCAK